MGNCMKKQPKETVMHEKKEEDIVKKETEKGVQRVKIVVTKEELQWLMAQLNNKDGKSLEDFLAEIERGREKANNLPWKPSLESITECPEVVEDG